jgi:malonyl-ACP O-methyltransferase BioC
VNKNLKQPTNSKVASKNEAVIKIIDKDKIAIAKNFDNKASIYAKKADIQRICAENLCRIFDENYQFSSAKKIKILDIGSGSSFIAKNLIKSYKNLEIYEVDLSKKMLEQFNDLQNPITKICADFDKIDFVPNSFDVVFSCFSLQWSKNYQKLIKNLSKIIKPRGFVAIAFPNHKNFQHFKNSPFKINSMPRAAYIKNLLQKNAFEEILFCEETIKTNHQNILDSVRFIKDIGANFYLKKSTQKNSPKFSELRNFYLKNLQKKSKFSNVGFDSNWFINYILMKKND